MQSSYEQICQALVWVCIIDSGKATMPWKFKLSVTHIAMWFPVCEYSSSPKHKYWSLQNRHFINFDLKMVFLAQYLLILQF